MSLLERRRALLETAKDAKEGGGINDGKYVVIRNGASSRTRYSASIDYGMSFAAPNSSQLYGRMTCAESLNSDGEFVYRPYHSSSIGAASFIPLSTMSSSTDIVNCTSASIDYTTPSSTIPGAWCFSTDTTRAIRLGLHSNYVALNLEVGSYLNNTYKLEQQLPLPGWTQETALDSNSGPYLKFNSDTLKIGFLGENAGASIGLAGPITCSFTRDGGLTWTDVKDIVIENSQSLGEHGFISSHMSNDGRNIGIVYQPENSKQPKLIVSNDYGSTFKSVNTPQGENENLDNFETSAKFRTWYLGSHNRSNKAVTSSVWKSEDQGQTWTRILYREDASNKYAPSSQSCFHCDDSGTRLVLMSFSSTGVYSIFQHISYSLDGGNTWTGVVTNSSRAVYTSSNMYMSRDSYNIQ